MAKQKEEAISDRDIVVRAIAEYDLDVMLSARNASAETEEEAPETEETEEEAPKEEAPETEETEDEAPEEEETDEKVAVELPQRKTGKNSK